MTTSTATTELLGDDDLVIAPALRPRLDDLVAAEAAAARPPTVATTGPPLKGFRSVVRPNVGGYALAALLLVLETLSAQSGPLLTQLVIDRGIVPRRLSVVISLAVIYLAAAALSSVATSARLRITGTIGQRTAEAMRRRVFGHVQSQSASYFSRERTGRLLTRITSDVDAVSGLLQDGLVNMVVQVVTLVAVSVALVVLQPRLGLITILSVIPATVAATVWFGRASTPRFNAQRADLAEVVADLHETVAAAQAVIATGRTDDVVRRHVLRISQAERSARAAVRSSAMYVGAVEGLAGLGQVVVLLVGARMVLDGSLTIGELAAFILYITSLFGPVQQLIQLYTTYQSGQASMRKLVELLAAEPAIVDLPSAQPLRPGAGEVRLDGVTFGYERERPVLHDVDLVVRAGERLALVGPSGSGKSTMARLLPRFLDVDSGRVLVDNQDVRDVTSASLRESVLIVPQEPLLFAGTVRDNLAIARPDADDAALLRACARVGADRVVSQLGGLDALINERGGSLSAGERQLLVLARSALVDARVLVLDEATSHLDPASESRVEEGVDSLLRGRTAVVVAHRISTALRADRVAVVLDGRIAEHGTPQELLDQGGVFAGLHASWMSGRDDVDEAIG